ncbi:MAG TPA: CheR family methyltransferase [Actinomycetota bacterium]|nr:CheR family methyltransferase [Actinomycetota bacterium]
MTVQHMDLTDNEYERFRDLLAERSGLYYPEARRNDLAHGLGKALKTSGYSTLDEYYNALMSMRRGAEMDRLVSTLTVGESYFFRQIKHFEALKRLIFPQLIAERARSSRRIRIWSAGCAAGDEAYSLAIALRQSLPNIDTWNITILATDIDQDSIKRAKAATYSEWSFREMDPAVRDLYFRFDGKRWALSEEIKRMVDFDYLNLVEDSYPSLTTNTNAMDVIFCRNVTIYFSQATTAKVLKKFYNALVDKGWLFVGASEPNLVNYREFSAVNYEGTIIYKKDVTAEVRPSPFAAAPPLVSPFAQASPTADLDGRRAPAPPPPPEVPATSAPPAVAPVPAPAAEAPASMLPTEFPGYDEALAKLQDGDTEGALTSLYAQIDMTPDHGASFALLAKTYANQGQLEQAQHWCERAIQEDKFLAEAHYTLALIYEEQGMRDKATESLRKTLFLDREHVLAHYVLGTLYRQGGNNEMAKKAWDNATRILNRRPPNEVVPDSDGVTTSRLLHVIEAQMTEGVR